MTEKTINLPESKEKELNSLISEFLSTYLETHKGKQHISLYETGRTQAETNYRAILQEAEQGSDVTDLVLYRLLPHINSKNNREKGKWVHVAPAIQGDIKEWFEGVGWTQPESWPKIAQAILEFVQTSVSDPSQIKTACEKFEKYPYSKGLKMGMLSPILNALRPDQFTLVNNKSRQVDNYFLGKNYSIDLSNYPQINKDIFTFASAYFSAPSDNGQTLLDIDRFDIFCHWLVAEKKYFRSSTGADLTDEHTELHPDVHVNGVKEASDKYEVGAKPVFSPRAFELLRGIKETPTMAYYQANKEDFRTYLEEPFQDLMHQVARNLKPEIRAVMETEKHIFSRFNKNDYGQGGAWPHYWGAFYPKGSKRTSDAQLSVWVDRDRLEAGFYIGEYGEEPRNRLLRNTRANQALLQSVLNTLTEQENLYFGVRHENIAFQDGQVVQQERVTLQEWLSNPDQYQYDVSLIISRDQVLGYSRTDLVQLIVLTFERMFPLVLLATSDQPIPDIIRYLGHEEPESLPVNPPYTLDALAAETDFELEELDRWVRAIERKKQAILFGPPGTGKTFLAEHLARHLAAEGNGFVDLVQFHPAYSYEDFIQGIRPQARPEGGLDYPLIPGRFLEFCRKAAERQGRCVLIIDEINRANLSRVFGELMFLLEYREKDIPLAGGRRFSIPENVRLIGTMNTADRSIALVDHALRRRFAFLALAPKYKILERFHDRTGEDFPAKQLVQILQRLNGSFIRNPHYESASASLCEKTCASILRISGAWRLSHIWKNISSTNRPVREHLHGKRYGKNWDYEFGAHPPG